LSRLLWETERGLLLSDYNSQISHLSGQKNGNGGRPSKLGFVQEHPNMQVAIVVLIAILTPMLLVRFRRRWVAAFNLRVTNRITGPFAGHLPGFGIITHVGRKSGRTYHTPVNVFRAENAFLVALTYGSEAEWVRNVLAAGGCRLQTRGREYQLSDPVVEHDPGRRNFPLVVRTILGIIGANDFLRLSISQTNAR